MISMDTIRAMADLIVEQFQPERIVLFGSYARGEATEDSDVDLLVELQTDPRQGQEGNPIRRALSKRFLLPIDVVIRTSEAVRQFHDVPYTVTHEALAEGKVLYERHSG